MISTFLTEPIPSVRVTRWLFLRILAIVNIAAFASLAVQIEGLIGSHGILPAARWLQEFHPTLPILSDSMLTGACWAGVAAAVLLLLDVCPPLMLAWLFLDYMILCNLGQEFLGFQWDSLLVEVNFLAIWLAPWQIRPRWPQNQPGPPLATWLYLRWLLFRLMFMSGLVKLESGDPHWRDLTALNFHYWTQPIPNPIAWYANRLPQAAQSASVLATLAIELLVPFLLATPWARFAFWPLAGLQLVIGLTGNYGFFNLLTLALCLSCLDDRIFRYTNAEPKMPRGTTWCTSAVCLLLFLNLPLRLFPEWRLVNSYGLFAVMTTDRLEIELEGSADGTNWEPYVFRYKPGQLDRRPPELGLHMPRLDWQMWFAALGGPEDSPWLLHLLEALQREEPSVIALFECAPRGVHFWRAHLKRYRFGDETWWTATDAGEYLPKIP